MAPHFRGMPLSRYGRVLVLGEDTNAFLATIRSFGRYGLEVHAAWCPLDAAALKSRYIKKVHAVPPYRAESDDWVRAFQCILRNQQFDLVLALTDNTILPFQLRRNEFESLANFCLLPDDVYRICVDKGETYKLAVKEGVPVPRQRTVRNLDEALKCAEEFGYPLVLKPRQSAIGENLSVRQAVRKARNERELLELAEMIGQAGLLVQENFLGKGVGVEVLCKEGQVLTSFQHERVHEPMMGGGSTYRKSVPLDDAMHAATCRLMNALRYTGVAMVEFKKNSVTGEWILVEINARFWGSLPLSIAAGVDFPRYLYEMLLEGRSQFPTMYRTKVFCRNWTKDIDWFLADLRADRRDPSLQSLPLWSVLLEIRNVLLLRERSDTFVLDDPLPAWADLKRYLSEKSFRVLKTSKFYRRRERDRLLGLFRRAKTVLVMCHGNICRSPFASAVLQSLATNRILTSAGTYPKAARSSPQEAVTAAATLGIDLSGHQSRIATPEELKSSDLIIVFDRENWRSVRAMCPEVMSKVAYLGAMDPNAPLEVQDPFGRGINEFHRCYQRVMNLTESLASAEISKPNS